MTTKLSPIVSEFETQEQADSYDRWFRAKVQAAMSSNEPTIPHDEVMAGAWEIIEEAKAKKKQA
ncbi:stability determinant [Rosenbergiella australiborealis]|uniref:Stability determinant n=1 Tax=Rosenbergiella australiborealis TaxID=1544696 RepID=A0ABS5T0W3_9GAMM|nr:stability determinant [Rosenbergiella australiborealis]MBT0725989.1 stability determinant [Rosenbergiella australiborealis]